MEKNELKKTFNVWMDKLWIVGVLLIGILIVLQISYIFGVKKGFDEGYKQGFDTGYNMTVKNFLNLSWENVSSNTLAEEIISYNNPELHRKPLIIYGALYGEDVVLIIPFWKQGKNFLNDITKKEGGV